MNKRHTSLSAAEQDEGIEIVQVKTYIDIGEEYQLIDSGAKICYFCVYPVTSSADSYNIERPNVSQFKTIKASSMFIVFAN